MLRTSQILVDKMLHPFEYEWNSKLIKEKIFLALLKKSSEFNVTFVNGNIPSLKQKCEGCFCLQTQNRAAYYPTSQLAQLRPSPRWTAQGARPHRK